MFELLLHSDLWPAFEAPAGMDDGSVSFCNAVHPKNTFVFCFRSSPGIYFLSFFFNSKPFLESLRALFSISFLPLT